MKKFTLLNLSIIALTISSASFADNSSNQTLGIQLGAGDIKYNDIKGSSIGTTYLYYNYKLSPLYSIEAGLLAGSDADWNCEVIDNARKCYVNKDKKDTFELEADKFTLEALLLLVKTDLALSERNKLYAKAGLSYYDYKLTLNKKNFADKDGVGFLLEGGWEYLWDIGVGVNLGLQHHSMGDLTSNSFNFGINYSF